MSNESTTKPASEDGSPRCAVAPGSASELRISGETARIIIINTHALLRHKFRGIVLWSLVSHITGHGSGYSYQICETANLDPNQKCGVERLKDFSPNVEMTDGYRRPDAPTSPKSERR